MVSSRCYCSHTPRSSLCFASRRRIAAESMTPYGGDERQLRSEDVTGLQLVRFEDPMIQAIRTIDSDELKTLVEHFNSQYALKILREKWQNSEKLTIAKDELVNAKDELLKAERERSMVERQLSKLEVHVLNTKRVAMMSLAAGNDCSARAVFEHMQKMIAGGPKGEWSAKTWQGTLDNGNYDHIRSCLVDNLPDDFDLGQLGNVMSEMYRRMCRSVHFSQSALVMRQNGLHVAIVPSTLEFDYNMELKYPPSDLVRDLSGKEMANILACVYRAMNFDVEIHNADPPSKDL
eukprot:jgi/Ulvmu1/2595/UM014_0046.1